jgi:Protein of unknown function, DUF547
MHIRNHLCQAMRASPQFESYQRLAAQLRHVRIEEESLMTQGQLKAFFINVYNSLTIHALIHQAGQGKQVRSREDKKLTLLWLPGTKC